MDGLSSAISTQVRRTRHSRSVSGKQRKRFVLRRTGKNMSWPFSPIFYASPRRPVESFNMKRTAPANPEYNFNTVWPRSRRNGLYQPKCLQEIGRTCQHLNDHVLVDCHDQQNANEEMSTGFRIHGRYTNISKESATWR